MAVAGGLVKNWETITTTKTVLLSGGGAGIPASEGYWVESTGVVESTQPVITYGQQTYTPPTEVEPVPGSPTSSVTGPVLAPTPAQLPIYTQPPPATLGGATDDYASTTLNIGAGTIKFASWAEILNLPDLWFARDPYNINGWWYNSTQAERNARAAEAIEAVIVTSLDSRLLGGALTYVYSRDHNGNTLPGSSPIGGWDYPTYLGVWLQNNIVGVWTFSGFHKDSRPIQEININ